MANIFTRAAPILGGRFLCVEISQAMVERAKAHRRKLNKKYAGRSNTLVIGSRWLGDLGEMVIEQYLKHHKIPHERLSEEADGRSDFDIVGIITEIKCQRARTPPKPHHSLNVKAKSAEDNRTAQHYVWLIFHEEEMTMYLAGYMGKSMFMRDSVLELEGEWYAGNQCKATRRCVRVKQTAPIEKWMALNEYQKQWIQRREDRSFPGVQGDLGRRAQRAHGAERHDHDQGSLPLFGQD